MLLLISVPPPMPRFHREALRDVTGFGLPASAAGLTYVAVSNATPWLSPRCGSRAAQVGLYWRAFQLGVVYQDKISGIMMRLAFPIYSRTTDLDELRRFHERATRIHAAVAAAAALAADRRSRPDLVPWVFGERWAPAAAPVQILAVAGMIAAVLTGYPQILLAAGRPRALLVFNLVLLVLYAATSWIAAPYGITALALSVVGVHVAMIVAVYGMLFRLLLGIPIGRLVSDLLPAVACSLALLAAGGAAGGPAAQRRRSGAGAGRCWSGSSARRLLQRPAQLLPAGLERRRAADRAGPAGRRAGPCASERLAMRSVGEA